MDIQICLKVRYRKGEQNEGVVSFYNTTNTSNMDRQPDTSWLYSSLLWTSTAKSLFEASFNVCFKMTISVAD